MRIGTKVHFQEQIGNNETDISGSTSNVEHRPSAEGIRNLVGDDVQRSLNLRKDTFLSCWHVSLHESAAMWRLYGETNKSVAIRTTFGKLEQSLKGKATLGLVEYIDYEKESMFAGKKGGATPFLFKRSSFAFEHELRAIIQRSYGEDNPQRQYDESEKGWEESISVRDLVEATLVSPTSEDWFFQLVKELTTTLGYHFEVRQSSMDVDPVF